jgi:hypothetical protein
MKKKNIKLIKVLKSKNFDGKLFQVMSFLEIGACYPLKNKYKKDRR